MSESSKDRAVQESRKSNTTTPLRSEAMEKTLDQIRGKVTEVTDESFNKAWDRVYGNKEYKPSWVGKITEGGRAHGLPPPKSLYVPVNEAGKRTQPTAIPSVSAPADQSEKPLKNIAEDVAPKPETKLKADEAFKVKQYAGIPEKFRAKHVPSPLKIGGKVVPQEQELDTWKDAIATEEVNSEGKPVFNKVVKQTNIAGWMDHNNYWEATSLTANPPLPPQSKRRQKINPPHKVVTANYDMVGKYENKVRRQDLKIGARELPAEKELKRWGEDLEIPDDLADTDHSIHYVAQESTASSPRRQKWNAVLKHSNVPGFFSHNNYWK